MSERASTMSGSDIPAPVKSIEKDLMNIFYENDNILCRQPGWKDVIRVAMEGRDLLACGGAHKSSAEICVPIISRYYKKKILGSSSSSDQLMRGVASPLALILCPSMEMCKSVNHLLIDYYLLFLLQLLLIYYFYVIYSIYFTFMYLY